MPIAVLTPLRLPHALPPLRCFCRPEIVVALDSNTVEDQESNVDSIVAWLKQRGFVPRG